MNKKTTLTPIPEIQVNIHPTGGHIHPLECSMQHLSRDFHRARRVASTQKIRKALKVYQQRMPDEISSHTKGARTRMFSLIINLPCFDPCVFVLLSCFLFCFVFN